VVLGLLLGVLLLPRSSTAATTSCLTGTASQVALDPAKILATRAAVAVACPCAQFDGSPDNERRDYRRCANQVIDTLVATGALRSACRTKVRRMHAKSTCGSPSSPRSTICVRKHLSTGSVSCTIRTPASDCRNEPEVYKEARCMKATHCVDAADTDGDLLIAAPGDSGKCAPPRPAPTPAPTTPGPYPTGPGGKRLAELLNSFRIANAKPPHPLSGAMTATAGAHVADLNEHPEIDSGSCIPHSWSNQGGLLWTGCCYTQNHAQADCMWRKPRELSAGLDLLPYTGNGYEIALRGYDGNTPEQVLEAFTASAPHRAVMLSTGGWEFLDTHPAMGAAMLGKYSVIWFGDASDPN